MSNIEGLEDIRIKGKKRKEELLESQKIKKKEEFAEYQEKAKKEYQEKLEKVLKDDNPEMDVPYIYKHVETEYDEASGDKWEYNHYKILTQRQVEAIKLGIISSGDIYDSSTLEIWDYASEGKTISSDQEIDLETAREMVEFIRKNTDPKLDQKGKCGNMEMTLRQALLISPDFRVENIGFKTYEELEEEKKQKEDQQQENRGKIRFSSIKRAINKVFGKGER